jgi:hypothetical protein
MDISELRARVEQHLAALAGQVDERFHAELRTFVGWVEGKQTEEAQAQEHIQWLQAHGYTVTKN